MPFKRSVLRYAHSEGHTYCTYTEDGSTVITCGSDGDFRTWRCIDDDDPTCKCLGEFIISAVHYDKRVLVSTDLNTVQAYNYPDMSRDGTELRFQAQVNCIAVNKRYIAAGSEDTEIRIIKKDKSSPEIVLKGHSGPLLSIDLSKKDLLASISGDGTLKFWDIKNKTELKSINGLPKARSLEEVKFYGTPSFDRITGDLLAFCNQDKIVIMETSTYTIKFKLSNKEISGDYSCCQFSPDGKYLAAGTVNGEISVWDVSNQRIIKGEMGHFDCQNITSLAWNPKNNGEVAYCDSTGQFGLVLECIDDPDRSETYGLEPSRVVIDEAIEDGMDGFEFDDEDAINGENAESNGIANVDEDDGISLEKLKSDIMGSAEMKDNEDFDNKSTTSSNELDQNEFSKRYKQQEPFQPGAAPEDLENRYLVWNNVGIVRSINNEKENSIYIDFHDSATHHNLHMNNYWNHNMAALSSTALALSSFDGNKLVCILLGGIGSKEWYADLPNCEGIQALAATENVVAIATDNQMLRIFTIMGTQREVIALPGPVVSMCGRENKLLIAYHSAPANENQQISALFIQIFGPTIRTINIPVPITPEKKLTWVGFSDRGSPVCNDTMGLIKMFSAKTGCWFPVCDTMKHLKNVSNNFYVVDILESTQIIHAVECRAATYPSVVPRPMIIELKMEIPMCSIDTQKSQLEETLVRLHTFNVDNSVKTIKESALKLFAIACHSELERRAKDLIEMVGSTAILAMAIKYATSVGRIHLADRLSEMQGVVEKAETEKEKEKIENVSGAFSVLQNSSLFLKNKLSTASSTTPKTVISPKPMVTDSKRNPFKKKSITSADSASKKSSAATDDLKDPVKFLLSKVVRYSSKLDEKEIISEATDSELNQIPPTENNESKVKNGSTRMNFMEWYKINHDDLKNSNPDLSNSELTKLGMAEYKKYSNSKNSEKTESEPVNKFGKRKLTDQGQEKQSGVAKLAKFTFKE